MKVERDIKTTTRIRIALTQDEVRGLIYNRVRDSLPEGVAIDDERLSFFVGKTVDGDAVTVLFEDDSEVSKDGAV